MEKINKMKIFFKLIAAFLLFIYPVKSEDQKFPNEHEWNFYSGMFDFSDSGANRHYLVSSTKMKI